MNILLNELQKFSKQNWWIYIIFIICLFLIYKTDSGNIIEVSIVFMFHFIGDLFIMMMGNYYINNENNKALQSQVGSFIIFTIIGIYAGITAGKWSYLLPQLLFIWPIVKGYYSKFKLLSWKFLLSIGILVFILYYFLGLINNIGVFIQVLGFIIFPIALIIGNQKYKYFLSLMGIFLIFLGSAYFLYNGFINKNIIGTDLSYTLLPLTVFIFYIKNIKKYL